MSGSLQKKLLLLPVLFAAVWLGVRYFLPVLLPFLLGAALALAAEPLVALSHRRLRLPRPIAAGLGVTVTLTLVLTLVWLAGAAAVKQLGRLASTVPDLEDTANQGMTLLRDWLIGITERSPDTLRPTLTRSVLNFFNDGTALMEQLTRRIPAVVTSALSWVPDGALGLGTGILSAFMLSARLPRLQALKAREPFLTFREKYLPTLKRVRSSLGAWLRAQLKLMLVCYVIIAAGFLILGIPNSLLLAGLVALVDAVPMLGTGIVLLPWALVCFLQQKQLRAIGLICVYGAAMLTRTILEPRLVGRQLGLDPLLTLAALYMGYRFWGLAGMLLAPVLASAIKTALFPGKENTHE